MALDICRALARRPGFEVRLATLCEVNEYPALAADVEPLVVPTRFLPRLVRPPVRETDALRDLIRGFRPHVVHTHLFEAELATRSIGWTGSAYFTHVHGPMPPLERPSLADLATRRGLTNAYERRLILQAYRRLGNHFLAVSAHMREYVQRMLPAEAGPVTAFPNAIDLERFRPPEARQPPLGELRMVTVGSLIPLKNHSFLLDALQALRARGAPASLSVLGAGAERQRLAERAQQLGVSEDLHLCGLVEDVGRALREAHVYVHAAVQEAFGLVIVEAMATGLPTVCLDGLGNRDLVRNGENGFVLGTADPERFADRVMDVVSDPATYAGMSATAAAFARAFDIEPYLDRLLALYEAEIAGRPPLDVGSPEIPIETHLERLRRAIKGR